MIILLVKIVLSLFLIWVMYQDFKERLVWNYHFLIIALCGSYLFYDASFSTQFFIMAIGVNIGLVFIILLATYAFFRIVKKRTAFFDTMGLGDLLFFIAFAVSFPTLSFINFFVFSILFTLVIHFLIKKKTKHKTIPLAGSMSIFLVLIYLAHWFGFYKDIYIL